MGSPLQNFEDYIGAFENQLFSHSFTPLSPPLCQGNGKDIAKMGYKERDVKQSLKTRMSKGGYTKGEIGIFCL